MNLIRSRLLRTAFHLLYHQFAPFYDLVSGRFFAGQWRVWQRAAIPPLAAGPPGPVLELGCGTGDLLTDLAAAGYRAVGVDLSAQMLRVAHRKARRQGRPLAAARASAWALPFPSAHFAGVVSTFPSEYIFDPRTLAEVWRVLQPGGRLIVVPAGALLPIDRTSRLLDGVAGLVYGRGADLPSGAAARRERILGAFQNNPAFGPLIPNMTAAGFRTVGSAGVNRTSVVLVIIGEKLIENPLEPL